MESVTLPRATPHPPDPTTWQQALTDYESGHIARHRLRDTLGHRQGHVTCYQTLTYTASVHDLPLSTSERLLVQQVSQLVARHPHHPLLGAQRVPGPPLGAWMLAPSCGITLTWMPHWAHPDMPVLLTLTRHPTT